MKVIVKVAGFYAGTWFAASKEPQDMPDAIAKAFLPPHGDQLERAAAGRAEAADAPAVKPAKAG